MDKELEVVMQGIDACILNMVRFKRELKQNGIRRGSLDASEAAQMLASEMKWALDVMQWLIDRRVEIAFAVEHPAPPDIDPDDFPF